MEEIAARLISVPAQISTEEKSVNTNFLASTWHCNHSRSDTVCDISCHAPGTPEAETDVQRYNCSIDGLWSPQLPPCVQVIGVCEDPGIIEFGDRLTYISKFPSGSSLSYKCDDGYSMQGNSVLTCQSDGQWSSEKPQCIQSEVVTGDAFLFLIIDLASFDVMSHVDLILSKLT
ncbi:limulus clotting factor C [Trichonephila inaurata madagascariensis]|uniref:Limulus clotting factor C n=1 Tax=Trichonephila inaurata madagascariensis TaxID=2747483 RepID=A0A8X6MD56_9ARAC|nr:limulus clotting factor C [Trichonephila inaurata madagascariensis]